MISSILQSLIRTNSEARFNHASAERWKQHGVGKSLDGSITRFVRLLLFNDTGSYTSTETIDPRFKDYYNQTIKPRLEVFENDRRFTLGLFRKRCFMVIPLIVVGLILFIARFGIVHDTNSSSGLLTTILGFCAFCLLGWAAYPVFQFSTNIRVTIFPQIFQFLGPTWKYKAGDINARGRAGSELAMGVVNALLSGSKQRGVTIGLAHAHKHIGSTTDFSRELAEFQSFSIVPNHSRAVLTDHLSGEYQKVPVRLVQCELSTYEHRGNRQSHEKAVVFMGLLIHIDVPKRFTGHTVIKRDQGAVGNWFGKTFAGGLTPVKLEDPRFEKRYEVYGTDQIEARYLLNPAFMERLVELEDLFAEHQGGNCDIQCAFKEGKLLFAIPTTKEWFATGSIFKPANFIEEINAILKEMDQLFAIIDVLKLDDRTGL